MNAFDKAFQSIMGAAQRPVKPTGNRSEERGKPVMIGPPGNQIRALIQHVPHHPKSLDYSVHVIVSPPNQRFKINEVVGSASSERGAVRRAQLSTAARLRALRAL